MNFYYFDTSAFLKRYVDEKGSTYISQMVEDGVPFVVATVTYTEMLMALRRKKADKALSSEDYQTAVEEITMDWPGLKKIDIDDGFHDRVRDVADMLRHDRHLKALDAVHLASALTLQRRLPQLVFMTADKQLQDVAGEFAFPVDDPEQHP